MLKNISRILMLGLVVTSGSVHATNNICVTLTDCERLVSQKQLEIEMITARITMLKPMPKFEPLLKHIDFFTGPTKELKYRTYEKAMAECPKGTRLPTIRELARDAQAQGAKGILEVYQVRKNDVPPGYELFVVLNPDKIKDQFYYINPAESIWT